MVAAAMGQHSILICEPDDLLVELLCFHLKNHDYHVRVARDGAQALAAIANDLPDAVILGGRLPVIGSEEVLRRIREGELPAETTDVPVMMLSERTKDEDIIRALKLGANDYILKPFSPVELMLRLAKLLREHHVHRWARSMQRKPRDPVSIHAQLLLPDHRELDCIVRDLSENGFMARLGTKLDKYMWLGLSLPQHGIVRAQVRWCHRGRIGGWFERPLAIAPESFMNIAA